ncbi:translation initiation factor eIF-2B subunit delta [Anoplophora glabripennis]|uniref:translation initiation factor eIF-2B subunit delta n=1 Tax=Anoplophora glabripennis TaxID=217634 RepID=UPI000873B01A|nr:translation initiation factor eIF-2B subunit delta [Anoplophora glabripennis]
MDTQKKSQQNIKKEKVGTDGLTKKERRALKVQAKQSLENNVAVTNNKVNSHEIKENTKPVSTAVVNNVVSNEINKNVLNSVNETPSESTNKQLTDKERRKLEWEKKLAEQKPKDGVKDSKESLSKAELKAKRREQQEAQRLAKAEVKPIIKKAELEPTQIIPPPPKENKVEIKKSPIKKEMNKPSQVHKVQLVQHLYGSGLKSECKVLAVYKDVHPAFIKLGVQYSNKTILGSNSRCLGLLNALRHLVDDLQTPPKQEFCRYLESVLKNCTSYLQNCRPFAVSMTNALRHFKLQLTQIDSNLKDNEKRAKLQDVIDIYINDDIRKAGDAISMKVNEKIKNGDIILTYGCSSLIRKILLEAHKDGKKFEVVVIDGRPLFEGREMARRLVEAGIKCTYVLINAVSYIMSSVTKVLLGAHALLTNGYVMSRIGTAQVALVAQAYNKPVLVCCETYKFSERVQTDSFVYNEIDDPDKLSVMGSSEKPSPLNNWKDNSKLTPLNLLYDVTPPDLVTAVVTEIAILPCTSVPVVLRINANDAV